jgi:uncharacterized DUF497 family protein
MIRFEWDTEKEQDNIRKHGIDFTRASQVFEYPHTRYRRDRIVDNEERWHAIGMIDGALLLVVVHTYRGIDWDEKIRIISARPAEPVERRWYEHGY